MHKVQQFILAQLCEKDSLRYSDMRPVTMEASKFMYHLKLLQKQNLVKKLSDGSYALSTTGKQYIDRAHDDSLLPRSQPRIAALVVCRDAERGILYAERFTQPALGYFGFPLIDIPLGFAMPLKHYVEEAFRDKIGLSCRLHHRADGYINLMRGDDLDGSLLAHIFYGENPTGVLEQKDTVLKYVWEKEAMPNKEKILPSVQFVQDLLAAHSEHTFFEYTFNIDE